jgi:hypothetical protein
MYTIIKQMTCRVKQMSRKKKSLFRATPGHKNIGGAVSGCSNPTLWSGTREAFGRLGTERPRMRTRTEIGLSDSASNASTSDMRTT